MTISQALTTAPGRNQRQLPLQTIVEVVYTGIQSIRIVVSRGDAELYHWASSDHAKRLIFQRAPGWQCSGGVWPGIKIICGCEVRDSDPVFGVSRERLLPAHRILGTGEVSQETRQKLQDSLALVHGGMAQNVGPILEMGDRTIPASIWHEMGRPRGIDADV